jgi:hypothetical protein
MQSPVLIRSEPGFGFCRGVFSSLANEPGSLSKTLLLPLIATHAQKNNAGATPALFALNVVR